MVMDFFSYGSISSALTIALYIVDTQQKFERRNEWWKSWINLSLVEQEAQKAKYKTSGSLTYE